MGCDPFAVALCSRATAKPEATWRPLRALSLRRVAAPLVTSMFADSPAIFNATPCLRPAILAQLHCVSCCDSITLRHRCPQGETLRYRGNKYTTRVRKYAADTAACA